MNYYFSSRFKGLVWYFLCTFELAHMTAFSCWVGWDGKFKMASLTCLAVDAGRGLGHLCSPLHDLSFFSRVDWLPCMAISGQHWKNVNVEAEKPVKASSWKPHRITSTAFYFQSKLCATQIPGEEIESIFWLEKLQNVFLQAVCVCVCVCVCVYLVLFFT